MMMPERVMPGTIGELAMPKSTARASRAVSPRALTAQQWARLESVLPRQRGNVKIHNCRLIGALLWLLSHDCNWNALPARFGRWHTLYTRIHRWAKAGVLQALLAQMQRLRLVQLAR